MRPNELTAHCQQWICDTCGQVDRASHRPADCVTCGRPGSGLELDDHGVLPSD